eukprot:3434498-Rhodomonas_salina.1
MHIKPSAIHIMSSHPGTCSLSPHNPLRLWLSSLLASPRCFVNRMGPQDGQKRLKEKRERDGRDWGTREQRWECDLRHKASGT